jgi:hypothetical protein
VDDSTEYEISSTQGVYEKISRLLGRGPDYDNLWYTFPEMIVNDLRGHKALLRDDYSYLDSRFDFHVNANFSNFYEQSEIERNKKDDVPAGRPKKPYSRWGMENTMNFHLYSRWHDFLFTPYLHYIRQRYEDDDTEETLKNILRGTLLYSVNVHEMFRPYLKSLCESVFMETEEGTRPTTIRETVGADFRLVFVELKLGAGFEKKVHDEPEEPVYGFEGILDARYTFWDFSLRLSQLMCLCRGVQWTRKPYTERICRRGAI